LQVRSQQVQKQHCLPIITYQLLLYRTSLDYSYMITRTCLVKRSRNQFGDHCYATAGPTLWNSLPEQLRRPDITFGECKRSLKTFMFG